MGKPDDYSLAEDRRRLVWKHAEEALRRADAVGRFPTDVDAVMEKAKVVLSDEPLIDEGFLAKLRRRSQEAGKTLVRALGKVLGALDVAARTVYIDRTLHIAKWPFLKLHETGHAVLPWQRDIFVVTEDCRKTLCPDEAEIFEREASTFASDVIFQLDSFTQEAHQHSFGIIVPVRLSKKYGSSIYMAVRRYVMMHHRACAVLVLEPPVMCGIRGFATAFRRCVVSPAFLRQFGQISWPASFGPDDEIGALVPLFKRKMSKPREISIVDRNNVRHRCVAEAFTQGHQVFVLIHAVSTLSKSPVLLSASGQGFQ